MPTVEISSFSFADLNRINAQLHDVDCVETHLCKLLKDCMTAEGCRHDPEVGRALDECRNTLQSALIHVLTHQGWDMHLLRAPVWIGDKNNPSNKLRQET